MKLSEQDADLFFELMWPLQFFVGQKLGLLADVSSASEYQHMSYEGKVKVRDALYENPKLINQYVKENPDQFSADKLEIVSHWKHFVAGKFYIERYLKNYAVFIANNTVYGVQGLYQPFDEIIHKSYLPAYVRAVLLPFKGQIVYDGVMHSHSVFFGRNIKADLKETYMGAKQRGEIITSFGADAAETEQKIVALQNWQPEIEALLKAAKKLRGGSGQPAIYSPAFSLVKASLELALVGVTEPEDADKLYEELKKVNRSLQRVETIINRM